MPPVDEPRSTPNSTFGYRSASADISDRSVSMSTPVKVSISIMFSLLVVYALVTLGKEEAPASAGALLSLLYCGRAQLSLAPLASQGGASSKGSPFCWASSRLLSHSALATACEALSASNLARSSSRPSSRRWLRTF